MNPSTVWLLKKPGGPGLLNLNASWKKYFADSDGNSSAAPAQQTATVMAERQAARPWRDTSRYTMNSPGVSFIAVAMPVSTPRPRLTRKRSYNTTAASTRFTWPNQSVSVTDTIQSRTAHKQDR